MYRRRIADDHKDAHITSLELAHHFASRCRRRDERRPAVSREQRSERYESHGFSFSICARRHGSAANKSLLVRVMGGSSRQGCLTSAGGGLKMEQNFTKT